MFYLTPNENTCFDLEQVLKFNYFVDEEIKEIDKKTLIIDFKTGHSIKLLCKDEHIAKKVFEDLCKYLKASKKPKIK